MMGRRETSMFKRGSCVILKSGRRMERREKTKKWSPNEMDIKSLKFQVPFILIYLKNIFQLYGTSVRDVEKVLERKPSNNQCVRSPV
jgi:predicted metal-dependent RNase